MRSRMKYLVAALAATTGVGLATAFESQKSGDSYVYAPTTLGSRHPVPYVSEPIASVASGTPAEAATRMNPIAEALNAEPTLKGSKLTVVSDGEVLVLTGVTVTRDQMEKAMQIAESQAGEGKVGNAITMEELKIVQAPPATVAMLEPGTTSAEGENAAAAAPGETIQPATPDGEKILPATPQT